MKLSELQPEITLHWSAAPGQFVHKRTGEKLLVPQSMVQPSFKGTQAEWNETLVETLNDLRVEMVGPSQKPFPAGGQFTIKCNDQVLKTLQASMYFEAPTAPGFLGCLSGMVIDQDSEIGSDQIAVVLTDADWNVQCLGVVKIDHCA